MRVIAGKAKRISLVAPQGTDTRPTTDRIKETLFNIIQDEIYGSSFLDIFAGSGAIGIEALSRGCIEATFIENDRRALKCIDENLNRTKLKEYATVLGMDVYGALKRLKSHKPFDIIFADPPYSLRAERGLLEALDDAGIVDENTLIIVESSMEYEVDYVDEGKYDIVRIKDYKTNRHTFIKKI